MKPQDLLKQAAEELQKSEDSDNLEFASAYAMQSIASSLLVIAQNSMPIETTQDTSPKATICIRCHRKFEPGDLVSEDENGFVVHSLQSKCFI